MLRSRDLRRPPNDPTLKTGQRFNLPSGGTVTSLRRQAVVTWKQRKKILLNCIPSPFWIRNLQNEKIHLRLSASFNRLPISRMPLESNIIVLFRCLLLNINVYSLIIANFKLISNENLNYYVKRGWRRSMRINFYNLSWEQRCTFLWKTH